MLFDHDASNIMITNSVTEKLLMIFNTHSYSRFIDNIIVANKLLVLMVLVILEAADAAREF